MSKTYIGDLRIARFPNAYVAYVKNLPGICCLGTTEDNAVESAIGMFCDYINMHINWNMIIPWQPKEFQEPGYPDEQHHLIYLNI